MGAMTSWAWCEGCRVVGKFSSGAPEKCAKCGGKWLRFTLLAEPGPKPYRLSENDRRLLRSLRIAPEV